MDYDGPGGTWAQRAARGPEDPRRDLWSDEVDTSLEYVHDGAAEEDQNADDARTTTRTHAISVGQRRGTS